MGDSMNALAMARARGRRDITARQGTGLTDLVLEEDTTRTSDGEDDDIPINLDSDGEVDLDASTMSSSAKNSKSKKDKNAERKKERKAKKSLPMFADVSEYAKMLEDDSDGYGEDEKTEHVVKRRKKRN